MNVHGKIFNLTSILDKKRVSYTHIPPTEFWSGEIIFGIATISLSYDDKGIALWDGLRLINENVHESEPEQIADYLLTAMQYFEKP
jgi:hypothetical protein